MGGEGRHGTAKLIPDPLQAPPGLEGPQLAPNQLGPQPCPLHSRPPCEEQLFLFTAEAQLPNIWLREVPHPTRQTRDVSTASLTTAVTSLPASQGLSSLPQRSHPSSSPPGDSLSYHSGQKFSTFDRDQDLFVQNCAALSSGAFWFRSCHFANLNGFYLGGSHLSYANGINWAQWKGFYYSLKRTEMKIRRA